MAKKAAKEPQVPSKRVNGKSPPEATSKKGKSKTSEKKEKKVKNTKVETASTHKVKKDKVKTKPVVEKASNPKTGGTSSKTKQPEVNVKGTSTKRPPALRKPDAKDAKVTKRDLTEELEKACTGDKKKPAAVLKTKLEELKRLEEEASSSSEGDSDSTGSMTEHLAALLNKPKAAKPVTNHEESSDADSDDEGGDHDASDNGSDDGSNDEDSEEPSGDDDGEDESSEEDGQPSQPVTPMATQDKDKDKDNKDTQDKDNKDTQSLAIVAQNTEKSTALVRNSTTNKKEWDCFIRATQNRKAFPADLAPYLVKSKTDLFGAWLDANRSWDKCRMIMERTRKSSNESLSGWIAVKGSQLVKDYGEEKAKVLMDRRTKDGLYYDSEDFPDDHLERMYYMRKAREVTKKELTEDQTRLSGEIELDDNMVKCLVGEDGAFQAGQLPNMQVSNPAGQKALLEGLTGEGVQQAPKKRKQQPITEEKSEEVLPKTMIQKATDLMGAVLTESTTARKKSMSLGSVNYAGELCAQLLSHAETMEKHYKTLQTAVSANLDDDDFYQRCFKKVEKDRAWFVTAEAAADSILSGLKRANRKKNDEGNKRPRKSKAKKE